mmetsp:Transcript_51684/g.135768  ORF Transcript_51684/g.135768 Transcript_51684/m.135768 type:complete len:803 (+) Transcript_51684:109-2517(+)
MNSVLVPGKKLCSIHRAANSALSQHIQATHDAVDAHRSQKDIINITVECQESDVITDSGSEKYKALFHGLLYRPTTRELSVEGPERDTKAEAIKDSDVMGKAYELEGELGLKRVAQRLERKVWSKQEIVGAVDSSFESLLLDPLAKTGTKQEKLIPPGEGWTRFNDEMLWNARSEVYFVQIGSQMGKYLMKDTRSKQFQEVNSPHSPLDISVSVRVGGANLVRRGTKLERTVLLAELPKIARLAMKFPLSFLDSPASAFALFQGLRSAEAADWCAKNFHTRLLPALASKIHNWETRELQDVLERVIKELDSELLKGPIALSGCSAIIALLLGDRLVVSGVGQVRAVLLFADGSVRQLLAGTHDFLAAGERERVEEACGIIRNGLVHRTLDGMDAAERILRARSCFEVLDLEAGGPVDEKQVRSAYRRLALRVHPDKRSEAVDVEAYTKAFAQLDAAKDAAEAILAIDGEACRELYKVLRADVHTREGAAELLGVDKAATTDTEQVAEEAEKAARWQIKRLEKLETAAAKEHGLAKAMCNEAVETLRRPCSAEALPRQEALLRVGLPTSRAIGVRDLRLPSKIVEMSPESASWHVPTTGQGCRLALLAGATAAIPSQRLATLAQGLPKQPKAAALRWCGEAEAVAASVGAVCVCFEPKKRQSEPASASGLPTKRHRSAGATSTVQQAGSVFLRHLLFRHQQLRTPDPAARREGTARNLGEAEAAALSALQSLLAAPTVFGKLCREKSDCQTANQPGNMTGHLGWVGRGEQETSFEEAAFALEPNEFSDLVSTTRGVHIIQRLG